MAIFFFMVGFMANFDFHGICRDSRINLDNFSYRILITSPHNFKSSPRLFFTSSSIFLSLNLISAREMQELSSEFPPAEITDLCAPASTDNNKEKPRKDGIDTRVSVQLTQTRQPKSPPAKSLSRKARQTTFKLQRTSLLLHSQ